MTTSLDDSTGAALAAARDLISQDEAALIELYKDLHQNPELGFHEHRTAALIAARLTEFGFDVTEGIGVTGVVGILRNGDGPTVMYRADMDANAVQEVTDLPYASRVTTANDKGAETPVAHMCGHDAHVTWMLAAARVMSERRDLWSGTLIMLAQPAEELIAGAAAMLDDGLYTRHGVPVPDQLVALHTFPLSTGTVVHCPGVRMAGTDQLDVVFHGVGGHGAMPQLARDPIVMAANAIVQYQSVVSRAVDPLDTAVLTVGSVQAGNDNNVIPAEALLKLNLRWFEQGVRSTLLSGIDRINRSLAAAGGIEESRYPSTTMKGHSRPLVNTPALVERLSPMFDQIEGINTVLTDLPPFIGSEDCGELVPDGANVEVDYVLVGTAPPAMVEAALAEGKVYPFSNHNGNYRVDLDGIALGARVGTGMLLTLLAPR